MAAPTQQETERELQLLDAKLKTVLPEEYQECYEDVQPVSMGSAGLKFDAEGRVAWDELWGSFCDLAMAGGPPHQGKLLEPAQQSQIEASPERYREVVAEIRRGIRMVTDLDAEPSPNPGWVRMKCPIPGMSGWLVRAICMENVSAYAEGQFLELPAGPEYRLEKEIKNVVTVIAKTCHYFVDHMWAEQQRQIADLFEADEASFPLIQPAVPGHGFDQWYVGRLRERVAEQLPRTVGMTCGGPLYQGWLGVECSDVKPAIWMMRALAVNGVVARREGTILYLPIHPNSDPDGARTLEALAKVRSLANARIAN